MTEHNEPKSLKVWDPIVRIGHWAIVIGVLTAYFSGDESRSVHTTAGYVVASVVIFRLLWGVIGTKHARFSDFVRGPGAVIGYLRDIASGKGKRFIGHNPAGGAMILALLFSMLVTTGSGMAMYAMDEGKGPLAPVIAMQADTDGAAAPATTSGFESHEDDDDDHEGEEHEGHASGPLGTLYNIHKIFTYLTLGLAGLHVIGVIVSSRAHGENLAKAMVTGRKREQL